MKLARVFFAPVNVDKSGDWQLEIDLLIRPDRTVSAKFQTFGQWRTRGYTVEKPSPVSVPFVLLPDGRMDWGHEYGEFEHRWDHCDIFSNARTVFNNKFITVVSLDEENKEIEHDYRIDRIHDLAAHIIG